MAASSVSESFVAIFSVGRRFREVLGGVQGGFGGWGKGGGFAHPLFFAVFSSVCRQPGAPGPVGEGGGRPPPPNGGHGARIPPRRPLSSPGASAPPSPCQAGVGSKINLSPPPPKKNKAPWQPPEFFPHLQVAFVILHGCFFLPDGFLLLFLHLGDTWGQPDARHRHWYSCGGDQVSFGGGYWSPQGAKRKGGDPPLLTRQRLSVTLLQCL